MIGRGHHPDRQRGLDPLDQGAQVSLGFRVLLKQVGQPPSPALRQRGARLLQICALGSNELLMCLGEPPLCQLGPGRVTASEKPGKPPPGRFLCVGRSSGHHCVAGQRRWRHQSLRQHLHPSSGPPLVA
jgi:hypothetical protein